MIEICVCTTTH